MDIVEAVLEPRMHTTNCPPNTWEEGIPEDSREKTEEWGQVWADDPTEIGAANNLLIEDGTYQGAADPRWDGYAVGFTHPRNRGRGN